MSKQALLDGTLEEGDDFDQYQEADLLKNALALNSWTIKEFIPDKGGYVFVKIANGANELSLHVYLKKVMWRHRKDYEKGIQFGADHKTTGFDVEQTATEKTIIIGIYKREAFDDYLICAWQPEEWGNRGKAFNCFINVDALAQAFVFGFSSDSTKQTRRVFAFRPQFIHYYLLNSEALHGRVAAHPIAEEQKVPFLKIAKAKQPLNQILYGPPGTGKTHNSINHALSIISGYDLREMQEKEIAEPGFRERIKKEFDALLQIGQIQFVTFHQSYSYEEFVEGIKPKIDEHGDVHYEIETGIFKNLVFNAIHNLQFLKTGDQVEYARDTKLEIVKATESLVELKKSDGQIIPIPTELILLLYKAISEGRINLEDIGDRGKNGTHIQELISKKYDKYIFGYDSILRAVLNHLVSVNTGEQIERKNYVLIIDEINRGNISKIFGELITLIEDSKRIGASEELRLKLTYSGSSTELFGVPDNLYIIGTMNSADRSIALMDTALRRRFTFHEYEPIPSLLSDNVEDINLRELLNTINRRIEFLLDKEHSIGHAYFLSVKTKEDLCRVFRNKVIPLLEEYFYGDYEKIQLVLADNKDFGKNPEMRLIVPKSVTQKKMFGREIDGFEERSVYEWNKLLKDEKYQEITADFFKSIYSNEEKES